MDECRSVANPLKTRRQFIKHGALFVPLIFVPRLIRAQGFRLRDSAFVGNVRAPAAGGGPTLVAQDNFDSYADGSDLDAAANWVTSSAACFVVNKPASDGSIYPGDNTVKTAYNTATFNANHRAEITIDAVATGGGFDWIGAAVRVQSGTNGGYIAVFSSTDLYLIKINSGVAATLNSDTAVTLAAGNRVAIEANGAGSSTRLKVQTDTGGGWVDKWTAQDPGGTYLDGGAAGIGGWLLSGFGNRIDDWKGYDL